MKAEIMRLFVILTVLIVICSSAQGDRFELGWSTIDAGGSVSSGGQYTVMVTIGEPEVGESSGGRYEMTGGFWPSQPLCTVDFHYFARFADWWLVTDCNAGNDWCGGADLDQLGDVDLIDLRLFVNEWLYWCPLDWPLK
jgi:hypothetical protein